MHLFTAGFGLTAEMIEDLGVELRRTAALFPQLDQKGIWERQPIDGVYVGGVPTPDAVAAPRRYFHEHQDELVFFDGLPIDPSGRLAGHRAEELAGSWTELPARLEGRFAAVRYRSGERDLEVLIDALGVMQLYVVEKPGMSIISNSADLLARAIGNRRPDPLGVSTLLTAGWVAGDRTLRSDVRVADGGQHWTWRAGDRGWSKRRYWRYTDPGQPVRRVDDSMASTVSSDLAAICAAAATVNGSINSPLTGGKDSRMLATVLMANDIPAHYWCKGVPESLDVQISLAVAEDYGLPHRIVGRPTERDGVPSGPGLDEWDALTREFVQQNDGLPHLALVGNILGQPTRVDQLAVTMSAMCAEAARDMRAQDFVDGPGASAERTSRYMAYWWAGVPRPLMARDAYEMARTHLRDVTLRLADEGVAVDNLQVGFYLDERARRWAPNNPRELAQTEDKVLPFLTRPYLDAALAIHPEDRLNAVLHRRVMELNVPGMLDGRPYAHGFHEPVPHTRKRRVVNGLMSRLPYPILSPLTQLRERLRPTDTSWANWTAYDEAAWLEDTLAWSRDLCLSRTSSPLWEYIQRPALEHLLDPQTPAQERQLNEVPLFSALGLFLHEAIEEQLAGSSGTPAPSEAPLPPGGQGAVPSSTAPAP